MKILNNMDWDKILRRANPNYSDYVSQEDRDVARDRKNNRRDFDKEIFEEDLKEAVAAGDWIKLNGRPETSYKHGSSRGDFWCKILSMSDKQVRCMIDSAPERDKATIEEHPEWYEERMSKANLYKYIVKPIETAQF